MKIILFIFLLSSYSLAIHRGESLNDHEKPEIWRLYAVPFGTIIDTPQDLITHSLEWCTAVAISNSQALSAAHCVYNLDQKSHYDVWLFQVGAFSNPIKVDKILSGNYKGSLEPASYDPQTRYHPDYIPGCRPGPVPLLNSQEPDLALLEFANGTFLTWSEINYEYHPKIGDEVEFWGHGERNNSLIGSSRLRANITEESLSRAKTKIESFNLQRLGFSSPLLSKWADIGDSGGPVYYKNQLIAILSTMEEKCESETGHDYSILNTATRASLIQMLK